MRRDAKELRGHEIGNLQAIPFVDRVHPMSYKLPDRRGRPALDICQQILDGLAIEFRIVDVIESGATCHRSRVTDPELAGPLVEHPDLSLGPELPQVPLGYVVMLPGRHALTGLPWNWPLIAPRPA